MASTSERRVKSKMKKEDPNNFSIHDFLAECKINDSSDSRFDDAPETSRGGTRKAFVLGAAPNKLGNLYQRIGEVLARDKGFTQKSNDSGRFHMILGGCNGHGIPFKRFSQLFKWDYGITPHCNYFRNHLWLTQKVKLVQSLRQTGSAELMPDTFLYFPSTAEDSELDELRAASESGSKCAVRNNTWIARATDASKGEKTLISDDFGAIVQLLELQDKTSAAWTVQRYISDPLLLPGGRKFDLRYFVLLDSEFRHYLCTEAVLKYCSQAFSMEDLTDKAAHLSLINVAAPTQDFCIEQFAKWLNSKHGAHYEDTIMAPVRAAIAQAIASVKENMINAEHVDFTSFQVFAFDFIVDAHLKVWLLEASTPYNFPKEIVADMAKDIVDIAIKPIFAQQDGGDSRSAAPVEGRLFCALEPVEPAIASRRSSNNKK